MYRTLAALLLALPAALPAQTDLACPELRPRTRTLKISRMQPLRRGKEWLPGTARTVNLVSCDMYGMKIEEAEYEGKNLVLKHSYSYKEKEESKALCDKRKSEEKLTSTFSEEAQSSLDDFCRANKKKDFAAVFVYDASPSQGRETARKPVRQIFRIFNARGFVTEEHSFDPMMNLESLTLFAYDKANNLTEKTVNDAEGRQLKRETYAWDKPTASRIKSVYGQNNELRARTVYARREDGTLRRELRTDYDSGEQPLAKTEIYCDERGLPQTELAFDADSAEARYEYAYTHKLDAKKNWTEQRRTRVTIYDGVRVPDVQRPPEITLRDFIYY